MAEPDVTFEFKTHTVTGHGGFVVSSGNRYPHVLRLTLSDETRKSLPSRVILKKEDEELLKRRGDDAPNLFDAEVMTYRHLQALQGEFIPEFHGVTKVAGSRAMILSDIGGVALMDDHMPSIEEDQLRHGLRKPLEAIRLCGVLLDDISPENIHYCGGDFIAFDFEFIEMRSGRIKDMMEEVDLQVDMLVEWYKERQDAIHRDQQQSRIPRASVGKGVWGWNNYL
ncbi:hypothetical protein BHE90_017093 [Fusarium euwallaceae]|uniref:Aminoglycoside phosphotransferase domain-containing protein n=1 Tax=Fusarium euwallaceae TaxID=1147111 RepID=A0A430KYJ4_9HYPO|nr:hypothetical protein BHE90_017093 [Fusarium euwallaceae]